MKPLLFAVILGAGFLGGIALDQGAEAAELRVPGEYATIQTALDAATPGDIVLVAPGTYHENLRMKSGVTLASEVGPEVTMTEAAGAGSVIDCVEVSGQTTIRGFHITGGSGTGDVNGRFGGGIRCWTNASPRIERNVFTGNRATFGGAIACRYGSAPLISQNVFRDNVATWEGGGIYAIDGDGARIRIESNHVSGNEAVSGGGIWVGGIDCEIESNVVIGNRASFAGGGVWAGFFGDKNIVRNLLAHNASLDLGGGLWLNEGSAQISSNTFYSNAAPRGGGIATGGFGSKQIANNILANSGAGAGVHCTAPGNAVLECNDIWENEGGDAVPDCVIDGGRNFAADPLFCNAGAGEFSLNSRSPCLPENKPTGCGLIGAFGGGCEDAPVSVTPADWGQVKALYR